MTTKNRTNHDLDIHGTPVKIADSLVMAHLFSAMYSDKLKMVDLFTFDPGELPYFAEISGNHAINFFSCPAGRGLYVMTRHHRDALYQVLPAHAFNIGKYDLSRYSGRQAAREYLRRKVMALSPF